MRKILLGTTPPSRFLPVLHKLKEVYLIWFNYYQILPKFHRYSLGPRVDSLFVEAIEACLYATYLPRQEKLLFIQTTIRKIETVNVFLMILWETKSLDDKKYIDISTKLNNVGKMLGGWQGQINKSLNKTPPPR